MNTPKVVILLAACNGVKWIREQLISIINQEGIDITVFVSIDLSSDGTEDMVNMFACNYSNIVVLPYGEKYGSATLNFFRLIRDTDIKGYDYIGFSDQDDIWLRDKITNSIAMMKEANSSGYSSNVEAFWGSGRRRLVNKAQKQTFYDFLFEGGGPGCTYLLDSKLASELKEYLIEHRDLDGKISHHDWFYYAFARVNNYTWTIDKRVSVLYRQHSGNAEGANVGFSAVIYRIKEILTCNWIQQSVAIIDVNNKRSFLHMGKTSMSRINWIILALHCYQCRRKFKDKAIFFFACLALSIMGTRKAINE